MIKFLSICVPLLVTAALVLAPFVYPLIRIWSARKKRGKLLRSNLQSLRQMIGQMRSGEGDQDLLNDFYSMHSEVCKIIEEKNDPPERMFLMELDRMMQSVDLFAANLNAATKTGDSVSVASEIAQLTKLRNEGKISAEEFQAFSERFKVSSGKKATQIINAIGKLHEQHKNGAISEGNYKASLWTLMDKLDRKV